MQTAVRVPATEGAPADLETMRATAARALALPAPAPADEMDILLGQLRGHLALMIDEVEALVHVQPQGEELRACLAMAGAREGRRKLDLPEQRSPAGQFALSRRLARVLAALCNHHDQLTGTQA
ncbi:DUF6415 family natural product biosynthesis protein [Streptomyces longisporus]|uniref:Uncharacterized protein n=1 Tax=Streptomyces longisporus TaxID=1948 RepID=A0ABN3NJY1_STRLO